MMDSTHTKVMVVGSGSGIGSNYSDIFYIKNYGHSDIGRFEQVRKPDNRPFAKFRNNDNRNHRR